MSSIAWPLEPNGTSAPRLDAAGWQALSAEAGPELLKALAVSDVPRIAERSFLAPARRNVKLGSEPWAVKLLNAVYVLHLLGQHERVIDVSTIVRCVPFEGNWTRYSSYQSVHMLGHQELTTAHLSGGEDLRAQALRPFFMEGNHFLAGLGPEPGSPPHGRTNGSLLRLYESDWPPAWEYTTPALVIAFVIRTISELAFIRAVGGPASTHALDVEAKWDHWSGYARAILVHGASAMR